MWLREAAYDHGILARRPASVPVVCVGNLSMGGTGKTPMVEYCVRRLAALGRRPGIVSRGYRRKTDPGQFVLISDGQRILADAEAGGDEPVLLARSLANVAVAVCADRYRAAMELATRGLCDCVVLDDGFQHLALQRDADIVLLDARADLQAMRLLPAGSLREPAAALARAAAVVHTKVPPGGSGFLASNRATAERAAPGVAQFVARFAPDNLVRFGDNAAPRHQPATDLNGMRVLAFAGIAHPGDFFAQLRELGAEVVECPLADHAPIIPELIARFANEAVRAGCDALVTTTKDAVKLPTEGGWGGALPLFMLERRVELDDPAGFDALLARAMAGASQA